ncbi:CHAT domain-containing protein [Vannielia litorea]|uniref:CHAT domain-containing protein n=1 Tax=Vannielia litorea TaxID=1217970 RepID=UPI001C966973|nr:CHAT domain-containing tetratricopeptide repeat protein [Vannielia litorea]MBY6047174.1 CHAT domain-containing protein [Vannielia litorea]MBY6074588.1 CHAT domain-containing protein [Vannielia litorea]
MHEEADRFGFENRPAEAEALLREVLARGREIYPENTPILLVVEGEIASMRQRQGDRATELEMRRDIWERFRKVSTVYHPSHAIAQMNLATSLAAVGRRREALPLAIEAVSVAEALHGPDGYVANIWRGNVAEMLRAENYGQEALDLFRTSLAGLEKNIVEENNPNSGGLYRAAISMSVNVAELLKAKGEDQAALEQLRDTIPRVETYYGPADLETIAHKLKLAEYLVDVRDYDGMDAVIRQVMPQIDAIYGADNPFTARAMSVHALYYLRGGPDAETFPEGLAMLQAASEMFHAVFPAGPGGGAHESWGMTELNLAAVLSDVGDWDGAVRAALRAEQLGNASRQTLLEALDTAGVKKAWSWGEVIDESFRIAQETSQTDAGHALYQMVARLTLGDSPAAAMHRAITDSNDREEALQTEYAALMTTPVEQRDPTRERSLTAELAALSREKKRLTDELYAAAPDFTALLSDGMITVKETQSLLGPEEAVVMLDVGPRPDDWDFIFVITADQRFWLPMPLDPTEVAEKVSELRASVNVQLGVRAATALKAGSSHAEGEFALEAAHWLYEQTFGVVEKNLEGKTHLYVELRGAMAALPPQLLVRRPASSLEEADWMVRHHAITVIPSVFSMRAMDIARDAPTAPEPILGVANPIFDPNGEAPVQASSNRGGTLSPLPETFGEVQAVAGSMGSQTVWQQAEASEAAIKGADLERFKVLYFATHGLVSGDEVKDLVVQEPALALTPGGGEDGLLTASEIAHLRMNPDWVVLSACNTAVGDTPGAEALSGLAQSFLYAGARALLVSHWPVESQSAVSLMTDIFARRANDPELSAAEAQRQAMLAMIDGPRPEWRHPAYWAPFILVGDPDR